MDRRQLKTKQSILSAFSQLLSYKNYSKITVQDIIDEANIGRSTFYSHFETKDALLKSICEEIFEHVFSDNLDSEKTHDFSYSNGDIHSMITHILYHLKDNKNNIIGILKGESSEMFIFFFKQYLNERIISKILISQNKQNSILPFDFLTNHISGSFVEMVHWWITNDMKQKPEDLSFMFMSVISPIFKG